MKWCLQHRILFQPLSRFQDAVIQDIRDLVDDVQEETTDWFHSLPRHVQSAYQHKHSVTQIPVLIHFLRLLNYPQTETLYRELSHGFPLMGELTPGVNWRVRQDQKYLDPTPIPEFTKKRQYIHEKLRQNRVDQHWEFMLDEIIVEVQLGRMNGPFKAPTWWPCETVCPSKCTNTSGETLPGLPLRPVHRDGLQHRTDGQRREHENSPRRRLASKWTQRYLHDARPAMPPHS